MEKWKPSLKECEDLLRTLVQTDTSQPEGNEKRLVSMIAERYRDKTECSVLDHGNNRASLVIRLAGKSPEGTAFLGHLDTVAFNAEGWKYPPLSAAIEDGNMYGRGTADMKGGDAAMLMVLDQLLEETKDQLPEKSTYFCFTADEEKLGIGVQEMVKSRLLDAVTDVVVCEPSEGMISNAEKGALWVRVTAKGRACHGSRPDLGVNAIDGLIDVYTRLQAVIPEEKAHPYFGKTTISLDRLDGGIMTNIVAEDAYMEMDIRSIPGTSHESLMETVEAVCADVSRERTGLQLKAEAFNNRPSLETPEDSGMVRKMRILAAECGLSDAPKGNFFYTDASQLIPILKVPFVIAGPGDDAMAHCMNEYVELESVARFAQLYYRYLTE